MEAYYDMMFKRRSVRKFDNSLHISAPEMAQIEEKIQSLQPLMAEIPVKLRIVPRETTTCRWGEYCLLLYSRPGELAWLNAGYMLEQMDLYLASLDIGVCWYGLSKPDSKQHEGLSYFIMLAFGKSRPEDFRENGTGARRESPDTVWQGDFDPAVAAAACLAPSACNMQPWRVQADGDTLTVCRTTAVHSAIMPLHRRPFFNTIDVGIFLCFLETALLHAGKPFTRTLLDAKTKDPGNRRLIPVARYTLG